MTGQFRVRTAGAALAAAVHLATWTLLVGLPLNQPFAAYVVVDMM